MRDRPHATAAQQRHDFEARVEHLADFRLAARAGRGIFMVDGGSAVVAQLGHLVDPHRLDAHVVLRTPLHREGDHALASCLERLPGQEIADLALGHAAVHAVATLNDDIAFVDLSFAKIHLHRGVLPDRAGEHGPHVTGGSFMLGQQA